jgi:hypothetical protein
MKNDDHSSYSHSSFENDTNILKSRTQCMLCACVHACNLHVCVCARACVRAFLCMCTYVQASAPYVRAGRSSPRERPTINAFRVLSKHAQGHRERCIWMAALRPNPVNAGTFRAHAWTCGSCVQCGRSRCSPPLSRLHLIRALSMCGPGIRMPLDPRLLGFHLGRRQRRRRSHQFSKVLHILTFV